jgi:excisionase family DNA binding protein
MPGHSSLPDKWRAEAATLRKWGAVAQAEAIERCISDLEAALVAPEDRVSVEEAAALAGVSSETVRREVRRGRIDGGRSTKGGRMHIRRSDLDYLKGKARLRGEGAGSYDPAQHARRLIRLA